MDIIILYGPPASGKLTIGRQLSEKLNYKLFHNHSIIDPLINVLDSENERFWKFAKQLRIEIINEARKEGIKGIIITIAYTGNEDDLIQELEKISERKLIIKLECDIETIKKRINNEDRKKYGKIVTLKDLNDWLKKYDINAKYKNSITIKSDEKAVSRIIEQIKN